MQDLALLIDRQLRYETPATGYGDPVEVFAERGAQPTGEAQLASIDEPIAAVLRKHNDRGEGVALSRNQERSRLGDFR